LDFSGQTQQKYEKYEDKYTCVASKKLQNIVAMETSYFLNISSKCHAKLMAGKVATLGDFA